MELNVTERIHGAILCCYLSLKAEKYTDFIFCSRISDQFLRVIQLLPIHKKGSSPFRKSLRCWVQLPLKRKEIEISLSLPKKKMSNFDLTALSQSSQEKKIITDLFSNTYFFWIVLKQMFICIFYWTCTMSNRNIPCTSWDYHSFQSLRMLDC